MKHASSTLCDFHRRARLLVLHDTNILDQTRRVPISGPKGSQHELKSRHGRRRRSSLAGSVQTGKRFTRASAPLASDPSTHIPVSHSASPGPSPPHRVPVPSSRPPSPPPRAHRSGSPAARVALARRYKSRSTWVSLACPGKPGHRTPKPHPERRRSRASQRQRRCVD